MPFDAVKNMLPTIAAGADALQRLGKPPRDALPAAFSLLVWNVFKGRRQHWLRDLRHLSKSADLALLQEAVLHESHGDYFHTSFTHEWIMARSFFTAGDAAATGLKTGSVASADSPLVLVAPHREPIVRTPKLILATHYAVADSGARLLVLNVHALNFASTARFVSQMDQMLETLVAHDGAAILAGDFNTWSRPRRLALERLAHGLRFVAIEFGPRGRVRHFNQVLDHVFVRGLNVIAARVVREIGSSDHFPLEARLELNRTGQNSG